MTSQYGFSVVTHPVVAGSLSAADAAASRRARAVLAPLLGLQLLAAVVVRARGPATPTDDDVHHGVGVGELGQDGRVQQVAAARPCRSPAALSRRP